MNKAILLLLMVVTALLLAMLVSLAMPIPKALAQSTHPLKKNADGYTQELIRLAWSISPDPNWILTLNAESGIRNVVSATNDHGYCQLNYTYHWRFINSKEFNDPFTQLLYCAEVYARAGKNVGNVFYGYNVRNRYIGDFTW